MINITANKLKQMMEKKESFYLIDVRSKEEYQYGYINNSINIPLDKLVKLQDLTSVIFKKRYGFNLNKETLLIFYCKSGGRSSFACAFMEKTGFKVNNLQGGLFAWKQINPKIKIL